MSLLGLFRREDAVELEAAGADSGLSSAPFAASTAASAAASGRRDRAARLGTTMVAESLGQKVLHGWLQNRHQTLVPLTLNFRVLSPDQREVVSEALAALLQVGRPRADAAHAEADMRDWLGGQGADDAAVAAYDRALGAPPALNHVIDRAAAADVAIYVYIAALVAAETRFPASLILCDLLLARFDLPTATVRTATRRYRR